MQYFDLVKSNLLFHLKSGIIKKSKKLEKVSLIYKSADLDNYAGLTMDRNSASQGSELHLTITDTALNIDPTDEDVIIFFVNAEGTASTSDMMWSNGTVLGNGVSTVMFEAQSRTTAGFDNNGKLIIDYDTLSVGTNVLSNDNTADDVVSDYYLYFYETGDNTGIFSNTDDIDDANLQVNSSAKRGTTATIDYNDTPQSFTVSNFFGTLDMDSTSVGDTWNSGEKLTVSLTDQDFNTNSLKKQTFNASTTMKVPTIIIGSPLTLGDDTTVQAGRNTVGTEQAMVATTVDAFSKILPP